VLAGFPVHHLPRSKGACDCPRMSLLAIKSIRIQHTAHRLEYNEFMTSYRLKGASGKVAGSTHNLAEITRIGSAADCDVQLDEVGLAGQQAEIRLESDGSLRLLKLQPGLEILLNGKAVDEALLNSGDEIRIGACRWVLQAPGLRPQKVLTRQAVRRPTNWLPWLVPISVLAAAALAWQRGWLPF
jgi:hypothetical protein